MDKSAILWEFDQSICSTIDKAAALVRDVVKRLKRFEWQEKDVFGIHMALEEALMNAIKHGNANDTTKRIQVLIQIRENSLHSRITDQGSGFDPTKVPDPCDDRNIRKSSGRGLALIKHLVDRVSYNETGNTVEFTKRKSVESAA